MTKMRETKMDVVRFTESDVVTASRIIVMALSGIGDTTSGNVVLTYNQNEYNAGDENQRKSFATAFTAGSGYNISSDAPIYLFGDRDTSLGQLSTWDTDTGTVSVNGDYFWDGQHFTKQ